MLVRDCMSTSLFNIRQPIDFGLQGSARSYHQCALPGHYQANGTHAGLDASHRVVRADSCIVLFHVQEFTAPRWQVPDDVVPGINRGDRLLQEYNFPLSHVRKFHHIQYCR
jgi:hypothetical protein